MNNICGICGGYVGNFIHSGTEAKVCNCTQILGSYITSASCTHCYCKGVSDTAGGTGFHFQCCNCGNKQVIKQEII